MTPAFMHLLESAHSLEKHQRAAVPPVASPGGRLQLDLEAAIISMVRHFPVASSGEQIMIRAALSLIPEGWLAEIFEDIGPNAEQFGVPLPLSEISCDADNLRALLEAIAICAGHAEVMYPGGAA